MTEQTKETKPRKETEMKTDNTSVIALNEKVDIRLWRRSFFTLLVAIHRSHTAIDNYNTDIVTRYITPTNQNPQGVAYDEKQVGNNFWAIIDEITRQTGFRRAVLAVLKGDEERRAGIEEREQERTDARKKEIENHTGPKRYEFSPVLTGVGYDAEEAWLDACAMFITSPGDVPEKEFSIIELVAGGKPVELDKKRRRR